MLSGDEEKYRLIAEHSLDGIFLASRYKLVYANPAFLKIFGAESFDEIKERNLLTLLEKEDAEKLKKDIKKAIKGELSEAEYDVKAKRIDGEEIFIKLSLAKVEYKGKLHALGIVSDISTLKKIDIALRESENRYRTLVENANDGIYIITADGFEYVNPAFEKLTGYKSKEIYGGDFSFWNIIHPDDVEFIRGREKAREKGKKLSSRYEFRILTKNGKTKTVEVTTVNLGANGEVKVMGILRDITERTKAEEEVRRLSELYYRIGMSINRSENIKEFGENILENIKNVFDFDFASIFVCNDKRDTLMPIAYVGYPPDLRKISIKPLEVSDEQPWEAVKSCIQRKARYVENLQEYEPLSFNWKLYKKYDVKELYTMPLLTKKELHGVVQVATSSNSILPREIRKILSSVSEEIAAGMAKIKAEEEMRRIIEEEKKFKMDTAHYFFNPITIAKGYLDLVMKEIPEEQREKVEAAYHAISRVEKVVKNATQRGEIRE